MKVALIFFAVVAVAMAEEFYTTKFDHIDINAILANDRLVNYYVKCLLEKGPCNEEGKTLRDVIPDALITNCKKCNPTQRKGVEQVIRFLVNNKKNEWEELLNKFDADRKYLNEYKQFLQ